MNRFRAIAIVLAFALPACGALADDLTGAGKLLCTSVQATSCAVDGDCEMDVPWNFNIPQFVEVDLVGKRLSTTKASDENRQSPITTLTRADGLIVLQGLEQGRAFSFVINEKTGRLAAAVARDGITVSVFGACTPMAAAK